MCIYILDTINGEKPLERLQIFISKLTETIDKIGNNINVQTLEYKVIIPGGKFNSSKGPREGSEETIEKPSIVTILLDIKKFYPVQNTEDKFCCYIQDYKDILSLWNSKVTINLHSITNGLTYKLSNSRKTLIMDFLGVLIHEQIRFKLIEDLIKKNILSEEVLIQKYNDAYYENPFFCLFKFLSQQEYLNDFYQSWGKMSQDNDEQSIIRYRSQSGEGEVLKISDVKNPSNVNLTITHKVKVNFKERHFNNWKKMSKLTSPSIEEKIRYPAFPNQTTPTFNNIGSKKLNCECKTVNLL